MRRTLAILASLSVAQIASAAPADNIQPATPIERQIPAYPASAGGIEGEVRLTFTIGADGHVHDAMVIDSNPKALFDRAALDAVSQWTYHPRTLNGQPTEQLDNKIKLAFRPDHDTPQRLALFPPQPSYPEDAYLKGVEGKVVVEFDIDADGRTSNIRVAKATVMKMFDDAATKAVEDALFAPLLDANAPPTHSQIEFAFTHADTRLTSRPTKVIPPTYPPIATARGIGGRCGVTFTLRIDGTVRDPAIETCYPHGVFESTALEAIKRWKFRPVNGANGPVETPMRFTFTFLTDGTPAHDRFYLDPHEWIRFKYTLTDKGTVDDIQVVAMSSKSLDPKNAILELKSTQFAPIIENGVAVTKPGREIRVVGPTWPPKDHMPW